MTTLRNRFRPIVWLVVLQLANVPIPFVHDHDSICNESISAHLAARHQGEQESDGSHLHFFFLGPVCWAGATRHGELPLEPGVPACPADQQVVAEVDCDLDIRRWRPQLADSLESPMGNWGTIGVTQLADTRFIGHAVGDQTVTRSASWQAVYSVMLI